MRFLGKTIRLKMVSVHYRTLFACLVQRFVGVLRCVCVGVCWIVLVCVRERKRKCVCVCVRERGVERDCMQVGVVCR